ncbi:hypothetical protein H2201_001041 [Coniosporium apollinis]|uniref:Amino acid permease/ SLC12A domain-containing protein n=1 Tax=Coniosporium apollinis TaxID=61459 RepID=A0ABQ9P2K7_9PEZI|nr:hypothetical protein H2201_001041 [Coniosporium apollinis]
MSGDLKQPSKAIPKGTLYGLVLTFVSYTLVILAMAASITRASFYHNTNVIQIVNVSGVVVLLGEMATSLFSVLMGVIGSAKLLQALARDDLIPGLSLFGQGTKNNDEPTYAIIITYILTQVTMLANINEIASFVTMSYLMTFLVTNLACFLLKISSAPNFRPSFHYFNWWTAAIGTIVSGATMFFVDGVYASACVAILVLIFVIIHYTTPPKPWGDVSQSLIYHQVRKYLLRLRQEHVKFWRPQILLFINDPRHQYKLIQFCNSLKKGALFVLGHVIVTPDFGSAVPEARSQQASWTKYIDFSKIKAFVNIAISPAVEWGARNIVLSAGLGGMRPNIVMMGFYNLNELRDSRPLVDVPPHQPSRPTSGTHTPHPDGKDTKRRKNDERMQGQLPTDAMRKERAIGAKNYVTILEDLLLKLQINVAIAKGFQDLELPAAKPSKIQKTLSMLHLHKDDNEEMAKKYIDLWPIQMSAEIAAAAEGGQPKRNVLTTNFDTYTLILQLGCILHTVPSYHRAFKLRVIVFVEYESDVEEERRRVSTLLSNLRIEAKVIVLWLASGDLNSYEFIVNGKTIDRDPQAQQDVEEALRDEEWWQDVQQLRGKKPLTASQELADVEGLLGAVTNWPSSSFQHGRRESNVKRFAGLKKMLKKTKRRASISDISQMGVSLGMTTSRLHPALVHGEDSDSDTSTSGTGSEYGSTPQSDDEDSAASENDIEDYKADESDDTTPAPKKRSFGLGETMRLPFFFRKPDLQRRGDSSTDVSPSRPNPTQPHPAAASSEPTLPPPEPTIDMPETSKDDTEAPSQAPSQPTPLSRPPTMRRQSHAKFTSKPVPRTTVASEDGPGPSIMFTDTPSPADHSSRPHQSIYDRTSFFEPDDIPPPTDNEQQAQAALGFPHASSVALSFNDLPCRAQHLILNELMRGQSEDTAVIFTTLPSPVEGTCESESDSVRFLSDLEVLCEGLPPVLLVHSNSMTVTMNL